MKTILSFFLQSRLFAQITITCFGLLVVSVPPLWARNASVQDQRLPVPPPEWKFLNGPEFPGAIGGVGVAKEEGKPVVVLDYDFSAGGRYVAAVGRFEVNEPLSEIRLRAKSAIAGPVSLRLRDSSGQILTIQTAYTQAGEWQVLRFPVTGKLRHYQGANDGKIHFPINTVFVLVHKMGRPVTVGEFRFSNFHFLP